MGDAPQCGPTKGEQERWYISGRNHDIRTQAIQQGQDGAVRMHETLLHCQISTLEKMGFEPMRIVIEGRINVRLSAVNDLQINIVLLGHSPQHGDAVRCRHIGD